MPRHAIVHYLKTSKIIFSNTQIDYKKVKKIAAKIDPDKFGIIPAYQTREGYIITDGNHRVNAAILAGYNQVPAVLLTKKEFKLLRKDKSASVDLMAVLPVEIKTLN